MAITNVKLAGYRAGVNPNSAAKIITFFLKSDRNIQDFIRTGKRAAAMLKKGWFDVNNFILLLTIIHSRN